MDEIKELQKIAAMEKFLSIVKNLVAPAILIIGVLGSIFMGITTPTEASGVGAFLAFLMVLVYRKFKWEGLISAFKETGLISSMVFIILFGATCFTGVFLSVGSGEAIKEALIASGISKWDIFLIMNLIIIVLGMFIDWMGIVIITLPTFLPIAQAFGFDWLWFVTMISLNLQASFLTPPFGYALFYVKGVLPSGVSTTQVWRGVMPFIGIIVFTLMLCAIFPKFILWLPSII